MKLIVETTEDVKVEMITEATGIKTYKITGPFIECESVNRNKRMYRMEHMRTEVGRYIKESVQQNRAFGELEHPPTPKINLPLVSHIITNLKEDNNIFIGTAKILDTPNGRIVKALLDEGAKFGVSTRGTGSMQVNGQGINEVQSDYRIATAADIVADPSAHSAFVNGIMEGVDWIISESGEYIAQQARDQIERQIRQRAFNEEAQLDVFRRFMISMALKNSN